SPRKAATSTRRSTAGVSSGRVSIPKDRRLSKSVNRPRSFRPAGPLASTSRVRLSAVRKTDDDGGLTKAGCINPDGALGTADLDLRRDGSHAHSDGVLRGRPRGRGPFGRPVRLRGPSPC